MWELMCSMSFVFLNLMNASLFVSFVSLALLLNKPEKNDFASFRSFCEMVVLGCSFIWLGVSAKLPSLY